MQKDFHKPFVNSTVTDTTIYSEVINIENYFGYSVQAIWKGTDIAGSFVVEASNDQIVWEAEDGGTIDLSAVSQCTINLEVRFYRYFRIKVTSTNANTVTINCTSFSKGSIR